MFKIRSSNNHINPPISMAERGLIYTATEPGKTEMRDVERAFARLFSTADGQMVLGHLQAVTFQLALGPGSADEQLRYMEGQRSLLATVLRLIDRGRRG